MADDPPYLTVGTEVSAKYKGAFCEAKIRKVVRVVKCRVTFKQGNGISLLTDDQIKGALRIGATVEAKHPDKNQFLEATINKIQDCSQYTVVFDDGDITTLRRSALCLKSGRHFNESETLDQLPLTHPEHFSNPVVGGRRGVRRRAADKDDSSEEEDDESPPKTKDGRKKFEKELDMGKVVCVDSTDKKKSKETWFPALVVSPSAQETAKIRIKDEYLVRSFRDGRYYTVPKKEITEFTKETMSKYDSNSNLLRTAVEKALLYLEKNELPPHWDRDVLFGNARHSESGDGDDQRSESEGSDDDRRNEDKDRFIAQLYKFMDDRGTPLNKVQQVCNKDVDLHKLYKTVVDKGGYTKVTNQSQWKSVTMKLGCGNMPSTSTINLVKTIYKKYLSNFEEFYRKLGYTWGSRSSSTSGKSRSSRSIFRERSTPSSSRESTRESKKGDDDDSSTASSSKRPERDVKEKKEPVKEKDSKEKEEEKEVKRSTSSPEGDSPTPGDTGSETSEVKPKEIVVEEPRKSSRGRQPKKMGDMDETTPIRKKRQTPASSASRDRDSSVASSTKDDRPPTPNTAANPAKKGIGRGKYKRHPTKGTDDEKEKEVKKEVKVDPPAEPLPEAKKATSTFPIRLGDRLVVSYPKSEGKTYGAKVIDLNEKDETFLVHYLGWNNRYDEWIDRLRVARNDTWLEELNGGPSKDSKDGSKSQVAKQRKGRNSSSATSNVSASSTAGGTPASTRSGASKSNAITSSPSTSLGKRRRSTSSDITVVQAVKRRRTRQKSGQDSQTGTTASDSDGGASDSDDKMEEIEKEAPEVKKIVSAKDKEVAAEVKTPNVKKNEEKEQKALPVTTSSSKESKKDSVVTPPPTDKKSEEISSAPKESKEPPETVKSLDISKNDTVTDKLKKTSAPATPSTAQQSSPTTASVSSPAPPSLSAAVGSSPLSEPAKLDIYEFQEDGADEQTPPSINTSAPKLKMFSPVARTSTVPTPPSEKSSPTVSSTSAEAVAKLQLSQDQEKSPVPIVSIEKMEGSAAKTPAKPSTNVDPENQSTPKPTPPPTAVIKDTKTSPNIVATVPQTPVTSVTVHPPTTPSVATAPAHVSPPLPALTSQTSASVIVPSTPPSAPLLTPVTAASKPVIISTVSKAVLPPSKIVTPAKVTVLTSPIVRVSLTTSSPQTSPPVLVATSPLTPSSGSTVSVSHSSGVTLTPVTPTTTSPYSSHPTITIPSPPITSPPPPILPQQTSIRPLQVLSSSVRPPVITISTPISTTSSMPQHISEKQSMSSTIVTPTITSGAIKVTIPPPYPCKNPEPISNIQAASAVEVTPVQSVPTISIVSGPPAKPSVDISLETKPAIPTIQTTTSSPTLKMVSVDSIPQSIIKQVPMSSVSTPVSTIQQNTLNSKPVFGPGPVGTPSATQSVDTPKQKKKKNKMTGAVTTPVKTLAPLPSSGAPPPPPVIVPISSASTGNMPTPGRKTPVKKRIPPPMDSPGKIIGKTTGTPGMPSKPGKMNPEAMNAAIASVGAATPPVYPASTPVITSTSTIYQSHATTGSVIFATSSTGQGLPPPPPVSISRPTVPTLVKSTPESIAASIAAVASMGSKSNTPSSSKSGAPTKRFMKDLSSEKYGGVKEIKGFSVTPQPQQLSTQGPPPPVLISKKPETTLHPVSQQSLHHQPPPPPITIQTKYQPTSVSISGPVISSGPSISFVKATPSITTGASSGHLTIDGNHSHTLHPQQMSKNPPVIIIPGSPVVIKSSFQHSQLQHHATMQPVIMPKPLQIETSVSSSPQSGQLGLGPPPGSMVKSTILPITVTPSSGIMTNLTVPMSTSSSESNKPIMSTPTLEPVHSTPPAVELKPLADIPPSITVTKATTVMKSVSPDIVAVSSYNSGTVKANFTPVKFEDRVRKETEMSVKSAPTPAQVVFHAGVDKKKPEMSLPEKRTVDEVPSHLAQTVSLLAAASTHVKEAEENSLLCEEIIPGSPTTGDDADEKVDAGEDGNKNSDGDGPEDQPEKKAELESKPSGSPDESFRSGNKPVIVVGPKYEDDLLDEEGFELENRMGKIRDDDDVKMEAGSVDSPMGPPSEGREADLPFRDSCSDAGDHSPPSSPSSASTISTDNSSRRHGTSRLSPTPEGGSSKSKDSDDDEDDIYSDVGSKSTNLDDVDSKHGSTRGSNRIRNQSSRLGRSPSPPNKRRRMINKRNKSPEETRYIQRTIRTSSGRKVTPVGRHGESIVEREEKVKQPPPPPPVNLAKPPKTGRFNFIPVLDGVQDPEQRIAMISQAINDLKEQHQRTKIEAASFDRRVKRWKRRVREKERQARQEATRATS